MKLPNQKKSVWPIAASFLLILLSFLLIFGLGRNALLHSKTNSPVAKQAEKLLASVYLSEVNLLQVISHMETSSKWDHRVIWENNIIPTLDEIKKNIPDSNAGDAKLLSELERLVYSLEISQQQILALVAQGATEESSEVIPLMETNVTPMVAKIADRINLISASRDTQWKSEASVLQTVSWTAIVLLVLCVIGLGIFPSGFAGKRVVHRTAQPAAKTPIEDHLNGIVPQPDLRFTASAAQRENLMQTDLTKVQKHIQQISEGDLSEDYIPVDDGDEFGILLQQMTQNLRKNYDHLSQKEAEVRAVINVSTNGVITMDENGNIQSFNTAAETLFQYKEEEILGKNLDSLLMESPVEASDQPMKTESTSSKANTQGVLEKTWARKKDGTPFQIHISLAAVALDNRTIKTAILRDLSEETKQQEEIEKRTRDIEKQNWIKTSISKVYDASKGIQDINILTTTLIKVISEQLNASVGTFYLGQGLFCGKSNGLELYGSYAFKNTGSIPSSFQLGEGLVGACASEGKIITVTEIPEDYLQINSGIGNTKPKEIILVPIQHNGETIGVMEFGTLHSLDSSQREFVEEIRASLGIIIKGVAERTRTEELSIEVNNQISAINRSNAAIEFDLDGNILTANDLFLDLMGYTLDEIQGKHHKIFVERVHAQSNEYKDFWKSLKAGEFKRGEFERRGKNNKSIWIQGSYNPILGVDGFPYKVLKVAVDITKQKEQQIKTEELSVEINNQISAINRSNAAVEFDLDGHVLSANDLFLDLMGYSLEEIKGKHHKIFVENAYAKSDEYKNFWKELKNGAFKQGEFERRAKNKENIWIQGSYNPIMDADGLTYKVLKIAVDITTQKKIQLEVQKQKEIVEAQEEELRVSNEELTKQASMLQASEEEMRQQQDELERANVMLEEKAQELEEQHLSMVEKNTALEQAQSALVLKTEELEKSGRYKSEFLANMSHELRTPLNSVIILSKLLQSNKANNLNEKQIEFAQIINKSGEDLLALINEVLDLAKVESGKIELEMESLSLQEYAEDSKRTFVAIAQDKGVTFDLQVDETLPEIFTTDKQRLNQVVKNLLSNAFKFTDEKGKVTLAFKNCKTLSKFTSAELLKSEQVLQISVTDSGIGIAPEKLQSVFEAFVQEDGTTQRKYGGTGLGLSISKELVKLLGGEIFVESEVGKGSTFTVYIPFENATPPAVEPTVEEVTSNVAPPPQKQNEKETTDLPTETSKLDKVPTQKLEAVIADDRDQLTDVDNIILVVEDDLQFAKVLVDQARENGFKVVATDQGDKALQHVEVYQPKAIILDMQLPVMDGWTVLKKLKASEKHAHIPVHVISGMDKTKLGLEMGAVEYLIKPIALDTLEQTFSSISRTIAGEDMKKVLIIEDDEANNIALQEMIKSKQLEAISAKNAKDARSMFKEEHPDLVVLDLGLPDIDGIELLGELKTQKKEVPVIVFTGRELTKKELKQIERHQDTSVVLKTSKSYDRLSEETELFMNMLNATQTEYPVLPPKEFASEDIIKGKRILIVDDDMRNIYALETVLEEEQVVVTVATNGQEAVDEVKNGEFDAVLMDIMMPVMDGYEATKKIREMGHKNLPIIALTAKAMKGDREKCLEAGVSDYMSKPLDVEKLMSLLRVWLYN